MLAVDDYPKPLLETLVRLEISPLNTLYAKEEMDLMSKRLRKEKKKNHTFSTFLMGRAGLGFSIIIMIFIIIMLRSGANFQSFLGLVLVLGLWFGWVRFIYQIQIIGTNKWFVTEFNSFFRDEYSASKVSIGSRNKVAIIEEALKGHDYLHPVFWAYTHKGTPKRALVVEVKLTNKDKEHYERYYLDFWFAR